jgi:tryptophan-rich sensory protein
MTPLIWTGLLALAGIAAYILWRMRPKEDPYEDLEKASIEFCRRGMEY